MVQEFRLPDAGEGLTEAEIVSWKVKPGETVAINDVIVEIETAKSLVELPSPFAGVVTDLLVPEGQTVAVGTPIIRISETVEHAGVPDDHSAPPPAADPRDVPDDRPLLQRAVSEPVAERQSVLVGYGPRAGAVQRKRHLRRPGAAQPKSGPQHPLAKPPVRKLAKDLGVDLRQVPASRPDGVITRDDVTAFSTNGVRQVGPVANAASIAPVNGDARVSLAPMKGVRKVTADAMVASAFTAPHVTEWVEVDVTRTMKLVKRLRETRAFEEVKLSPLPVVAAALLVAVRRHPEINASLDDAADMIVTKHYVNLGIAAATPRGLLVPVVKDAHQLGLRDLASAINELATTARAGRTQPQDMADGTITITNVGVFGVDGGTPILPPGQAAILAVGRIMRRPWVHKGKVRARWVTTLALSFDHRIVDGDLGSRVLTETAAILNDPATALS